MPGREIRALLVVDLHQIRVQPFDVAIDDHQRLVRVGERLREHGVVARGSDDQAVDALFLQHAQIVALLGRIVVGIAEEHAVAVARAAVLDAARQFREIRVGGVRHDAGRSSRSTAPSASGPPPTARSAARRIACSTFARTSADTGRELFTTCDTVVNDTPAMAATSLIVAITCCSPACFARRPRRLAHPPAVFIEDRPNP